MERDAKVYDVAVIGGGPAGLTAATYLGRFRRRCLVLEDGLSRARWIPTSHNIPGFAAGVGGSDFLASLRQQALQYGAHIRSATVTTLALDEDLFTVSTRSDSFKSRFVVLATGIRDHLPDIAGAEEAVTRSLLRVCPICDAYEAIDKRIAVLGDGPFAEKEARFLAHYSDRVTILQLPSDSSRSLQRCADPFERVAVSLQDIRIQHDRVIVGGGEARREFDVMYLALGCSKRCDLALSLGTHRDEQGALTVNAHQETSVPRLYAAGDVVRGLNQVVVAAAESAIAATDIHNRLRAELPSNCEAGR